MQHSQERFLILRSAQDVNIFGKFYLVSPLAIKKKLLNKTVFSFLISICFLQLNSASSSKTANFFVATPLPCFTFVMLRLQFYTNLSLNYLTCDMQCIVA